MNNTQVLTLRMPAELKVRLEREAKHQGVSLNQLANYMLNIQITQLEMVSMLESRLNRKSISSLKRRVSNILKKVPSRSVQEWDVVK
ncbi:MAG: type II toxin-antitoxin system HicB family antitoxin [candidate division KSB1 bacterium]|nr:type II toxin-antitoxin system HicB family antitoxin [candidate division KSB1 bacterium]MDZ7367491.1 type II toxin-antitoxin system HicB family antitoxin [candidate division KSB1 bacterium]MDZ7404950.1 type II toxin-antitoxin system HicB family antitoxin [candidate division KSB1 bacterium]